MEANGNEKKERLLSALDAGLVMIHVDARRPGVEVPAHLTGEAHLRLNLSFRFDPPDLSVGEWGVRATLSFSGKRFEVAVPWPAIFAITSHVTKDFWMYPGDMPPELVQQSLDAGTMRDQEPAVEERPRPVRLQEVPPVTAEAPSEGMEPQAEPAPRGKPHLRLVK
ncbi:MAG TPA: ClpXP protease specificity-enhancing factor SspB [Myxococcaceae bacterium]|nr:ClpXP protease specificity-enhancing factor SspB [Myxococcaceae bacterium]